MDIVRVGLIGCGSIAERELDGLSHVRGARVVATADPVAERARLLACRAGGARSYADYRRLLEDDEVDAVIISTPNTLLLGHVLDRRPGRAVSALLAVVLLVCAVERLLVGALHLVGRALERAGEVFLLRRHGLAIPGAFTPNRPRHHWR